LRASKDCRAHIAVILRGSPKRLAPQDDGGLLSQFAFFIACVRRPAPLRKVLIAEP
jgi:hypothetical protein